MTIAVGVGGCFAHLYLLNRFLDRVLFPAKGPHASRNINRSGRIRPWLILFPTVFALGLYLLYPVVGSFIRLLCSQSGDGFIGIGNYTSLIGSGEFRTAFMNNVLWSLVMPAASTILGLTIAQLTDEIVWGNIARSISFMPMAIRFVGASLIWKFVYAIDEDIGLINALRDWVGLAPIDVLQLSFWNNIFLMVILIWVQTGFAMVILSVALCGIPEETIAAAILDGSSPFQIL